MVYEVADVLTSGTDYSGAFNSGGGGFNFGDILKGAIGKTGLDSLLGNLFGGGKGSDTDLSLNLWES